jgi:hypothetical protein
MNSIREEEPSEKCVRGIPRQELYAISSEILDVVARAPARGFLCGLGAKLTTTPNSTDQSNHDASSNRYMGSSH